MKVYEKCASLVSWILWSKCWPRYRQLCCVFQKDIDRSLTVPVCLVEQSSYTVLANCQGNLPECVGHGTLCKLKRKSRQKLSSHPRKPDKRKMQDSYLRLVFVINLLREKKSERKKRKKKSYEPCLVQVEYHISITSFFRYTWSSHHLMTPRMLPSPWQAASLPIVWQ